MDRRIGFGVALVAALLVAELAVVPPASADGIVAAADGGPGIAIAYRQDEAPEWIVHHAPDGRSFRPVDFGDGWLLDLHVLDDGTLLIAGGPDRESEVVVTRIDGAARTETTITGSSAYSDFQFLAHGRRIVLAGSTDGFVSRDGGRTFRRFATWSADTYGFYAASAWLGAGGLDLMVPEFNTCTSSDSLEGATRHRVSLGGAVRSATLDYEKLGVSIAVARHGVVYGTELAGNGECIVRSSASADPIRAAPGRCWLTVASNAHHTIGLLGRVVLRLQPNRAVELHTLMEVPMAIAPDHRGRALVLAPDRTLHRISANRAPEQLFAPP